MEDLEQLTRKLVLISLDAGDEILKIYQGEIEVSHKSDASPVTEADQKAEQVILRELDASAPDIPVVSEEEASEGRVPQVGFRFFLVDPLDGTKEFISKNGEFTVNIALVEDHRPVAGVVYAPALGQVYFGWRDGGAFEAGAADIRAARDLSGARKIQTRTPNPDSLVAVASRSHRSPETDDFLQAHNIKDCVSAGSSLKFCLVARGDADFYPRLGRTMEWDTAAGHAVLRAAGGEVTGLDGAPFLYGKAEENFANPHFLAKGRP